MHKIAGLTSLEWHKIVLELAGDLCKFMEHRTFLGAPCKKCIRQIQEQFEADLKRPH